jgi:hypothetical protein
VDWLVLRPKCSSGLEKNAFLLEVNELKPNAPPFDEKLVSFDVSLFELEPTESERSRLGDAGQLSCRIKLQGIVLPASAQV